MKKIVLTLFLVLALLTPVFASEIIKGTLVMVYPKKPISTQNYQEGDFVYFLNSTDLWQGTKLIIPKSTVFTGYIDFLKLPVQGVNGAMSMKINKMLIPNGETYDISAILQHNGNTKIGGELTNPLSYNKSLHRIAPWRTVAQWVPSGEYEFGKHTTLTQRDALFVVFEENLVLKD